jgi:hypothetical protein
MNEKATKLEVVEPRLVSVRFVGVFDENDASRIMDEMEKVVANEPYFMFEVDIVELATATPEGRRVAAERFRQLPQRAVAVVGGDFKQRLLASLVIRALQWLDKGKTEAAYFVDRDEARRWMHEYSKTMSSRS